jgi:hypothetical protein
MEPKIVCRKKVPKIQILLEAENQALFILPIMLETGNRDQ